jgi:hypothetical protein
MADGQIDQLPLRPTVLSVALIKIPFVGHETGAFADKIDLTTLAEAKLTRVL